MYIEKGNYEKTRKTQHLDKILPHVHNELKLSSVLALRRDFMEVICVQFSFSKQKLIKFNCVER